MAGTLDEFLSGAETKPATPASTLDSFLAEDSSPEDNLATSQVVAQTMDPKQAAVSLTTNKPSGIPVTGTRTPSPDKPTPLTTFDPSSYYMISPLTGQWLADSPERTAAEEHRLDALTARELAFQEYHMQQSMASAFRGERSVNPDSWSENIGTSLKQGFGPFLAGIIRSPGALWDLAATAQRMNAREASKAPGAPEAPELPLSPSWLMDNKLTQILEKESKQVRFGGQDPVMDSVVKPALKGITTGDPRLINRAAINYLTKGLQQAPNSFSTVAAIFTGGAALLPMMASVSGNKAQQNKSQVESGEVSEGGAAANAVWTGAMEGLWERVFEVPYLRESARILVSKVGREGAAKVIGASFNLLVKSAAVEGTSEVPTQFLQDAADKIVGINPNLTFSEALQNAAVAFGEGAAVGGLMTGPGVVTTALVRTPSSVLYNTLHEQAAEAQTSHETPDIGRKLFQGHMEAVQGSTKLHVDPIALDQAVRARGGNTDAVYDLLGGKKLFQDAIASGDLAQVSPAKWFAQLDLEIQKMMAEHATFDPNGATPSETKEAIKKQDAEAKKEKVTPKDTSGTEVAKDVAQQLRDAKMPNAALMGFLAGKAETERAANRGLGERAADLYRKARLKITSSMGEVEYEPQAELEPWERGAEQRMAQKLKEPAFLEWYRNHPDTMGGKVINADIVREYSEDYQKSRPAYGQAIHAPIRARTRDLWKMALARPKASGIAVMTAGGAGAGKSTALNTPEMRPIVDRADVVLDGLLSNPQAAVNQVNEVLASGREVWIAGVYSPMRKAAPAVVHRFFKEGRPVPPESFVHGHVGSIESVLQLADTFKNNPKVKIQVFENRGKGYAPRELSLEEVRQLRYIKGGETREEAIRRLLPEAEKGLKDATSEVQRHREAARKGEPVPLLKGRDKRLAAGVEGAPRPGSPSRLAAALERFFQPATLTRPGSFNRILFEVAPNPTNKEMVAQWGELTDKQKQLASNHVAHTIVKGLLADLGVDGHVVDQLGGWQDDTNPAFALALPQGTGANVIHDLVRATGFTLRQQAMLAVSPEPVVGASPTAAISIEIGDMAPEAVHGLYTVLRQIKGEDGQPIIQGHTTSQGVMTILDTREQDTKDFPLATKLALEIEDALGRKYPVSLDTVHALFVEEKDYGIQEAGPQRDGGSGVHQAESESSLQHAANLARAEADRALRSQLEGFKAQRDQSAQQGGPDVKLFQKPKLPAPSVPFFSKLAQTLQAKMPAQAPKAQVKGIVSNLSKDERLWTGLDTYLDDPATPDIINKNDLLSFVNEGVSLVTPEELGRKTKKKMVKLEKDQEKRLAEISKLKVKLEEWEDACLPRNYRAEPNETEIESVTIFNPYKIDGEYETILEGETDNESDAVQEAIAKNVEWAKQELARRRAAQTHSLFPDMYPDTPLLSDLEMSNLEKATDPEKYDAEVNESMPTYWIAGPEIAQGLWEDSSWVFEEDVDDEIDRITDEAQAEYDRIDARIAALEEGLEEIEDDQRNQNEFIQYTLFGNKSIGYNIIKMPLPKGYDTRRPGLNPVSSKFTEGHFRDKPNILFHIRTTDAVTAEGKRALVVEEFQSDWIQHGREKGFQKSFTQENVLAGRITPDSDLYKNGVLYGLMSGSMRQYIENGDPMYIALTPEGQPILDRNRQYIITNAHALKVDANMTPQEFLPELVAEYLGGTYPNPPFMNSWHELAAKEALRIAVEDGYDTLTWTTGQQQIDRWESALVAQCDTLFYSKEKQELLAYKNGEEVKKIPQTPAELPAMVGKGLAEKLLATPQAQADNFSLPTVTITRKLTTMHEHEGYYLVSNANQEIYRIPFSDETSEFKAKYIAEKRYVELTDAKNITNPYSGRILNEKEGYASLHASDGDFKIGGAFFRTLYDGKMGKFYSKIANQYGAKMYDTEISNPSVNTKYTLHAMDITPAMRESLLAQGLSLFQGKRGSLQKLPDGSLNLSLYHDADFSTFVHEWSHMVTVHEFAEDLAMLEGVEQRTPEQQDYYDRIKTLLRFGGAEIPETMTTEGWEKIASAAERYFMEGKAPTAELRSAFHMLQVGMTSVYKDLSAAGAPFSPEVRQVFDRLLASQDEIDKTNQDLVASDVFEGTNALDLIPDSEKDAYLKALPAAKEAAQRTVADRLLQDYNRQRKAFYREARAAIRADIEAQVMGAQIQQNIVKLKNPELSIGTEYLDKGIASQLPKGTHRKNGQHPEAVADALGYANAADMIHDLTTAPRAEEAIEQATDAAMKEKYPDLLQDPVELHEGAMQAAMTDHRADVLRKQLQILASSSMTAFKKLDRRISKRLPSDQDVKDHAHRTVSKTTVENLDPRQYLRAQARSAKEARQLFLAGDVDGAFQAKERERLSYYLYREATEAKEAVAKALDRFGDVWEHDKKISSRRDIEPVMAARAVLAQHGMGHGTATPMDHLQPMMKYDKDTYEDFEAMIQQAMSNEKSFQEMTYREFSDTADLVQALWNVAKSNREITIRGNKMDREEATARIAASLQGKTPIDTRTELKAAGWKESFKSALYSTKAALRRAESWLDFAESDVSGPLHMMLFEGIREAITTKRLHKAEMQGKLKALLDAYQKAPGVADRLWKSIPAPELKNGKGQTYTFKGMGELLGALRHTGNKSNLTKLLMGREWATMDEDGILDTSQWDAFEQRCWKEGILGKAEYDLVQGMWNLYEELKPQAQKSHMQQKGFYFKEIEATPIRTPWGEFRGGYVPAIADPALSRDAAVRQGKKSLESSNYSFMYPTAGTAGFTKERAERYYAPLTMDIGMIPYELDKELNFIHILPLVQERARLLLNKETAAVIEAYDPKSVDEMWIPWLNRCAHQRVSEDSQSPFGRRILDPLCRYLRANAGMQIMFGSVSNALQQLSGRFVAQLKVHGFKIDRAVISLAGDYQKVRDTILKKSPFMQTLNDDSMFDASDMLQKIMEEPSIGKTVQQFGRDHAYVLQTIAQNHVNYGVWLGAYNQAVEMGKDEAAAIREADSAIRLTQGTVFPEDVSAFETGTPLMRLFTQFYTYWSGQAQLLGNEYGKAVAMKTGLRPKAARLAVITSMGLLAPAFFTALVSQLMRGEGLDADDDDEYLDDLGMMLGGGTGSYVLAMIPGFGQVAQGLIGGYTKAQWDDRIRVSPVMSLLEKGAVGTGRTIREILEGREIHASAPTDLFTLLGFTVGMPLAPIAKPIQYIEKLVEGEAPQDFDLPEGARQAAQGADVVRGLVTGK